MIERKGPVLEAGPLRTAQEAEGRTHGGQPSGEDRPRADEAQDNHTRRVPRTAAVIDFVARELPVSPSLDSRTSSENNSSGSVNVGGVNDQR
jgi:hypothetical protein